MELSCPGRYSHTAFKHSTCLCCTSPSPDSSLVSLSFSFSWPVLFSTSQASHPLNPTHFQTTSFIVPVSLLIHYQTHTIHISLLSQAVPSIPQYLICSVSLKSLIARSPLPAFTVPTETMFLNRSTLILPFYSASRCVPAQKGQLCYRLILVRCVFLLSCKNPRSNLLIRTAILISL